MKIFSGQKVVVTGGSSGIGLAIVKAFAERGADIAICSNDNMAEKTATEIAAAFQVKTTWANTDISKPEQCEEFISKAAEFFGGAIDVLINNAGLTKDNLAVRMSENEWDLVLDVNLKGAFFMSKAALKLMMRQRKGRIINISSVVGQGGNAGQTNYSASKSGMIGMTKSLAREFGSRNVLVNAVAPGFIESKMTEGLPEEMKKKALASVPLARFGTAEDVAKAVLFLAGPDSAYITGQVISVNGGMYM